MLSLPRAIGRPGRLAALIVLTALAQVGRTCALEAEPASGIAMYGEPAMPPGFDHFPYLDPKAAKGGRLVVGVEGTFDSLNPFNLNAGSTAQGLMGNVFQTLMTRSRDEPFTLYGLVADTIDTDPARSYATFHLDARARFSDGTPVTADDVIFSFDLLKTRGRPQQRAAFGFVRGVSRLDKARVRFDLAPEDGGTIDRKTDRELPLILALMPVLPRHAVDVARFDQSTLAPPVGSGPYRITSVSQGKRLVLTRDTGYWARDLPSQRGLYNFDEIDLDYYRDPNALFEAFQAGLLDVRIETNPQRWVDGYDFPAVRDGRVRREAMPVGGPKGIDGFAFNLRRPLFADARVRRVLASMFDFEWLNLKLFDGMMTRTKSFFDASEFSSIGSTASPSEKALLSRWPDVVTPEVLAGGGEPWTSDGSGEDRTAARLALDRLRPLGYRLQNGRLTRDGVALAFEILVRDASQERLALNYAVSLSRIGVVARVRRVDETQYERRRQTFDYDMIIGRWVSSASPGNEQRMRWGSKSVAQEASFNFSGVANPAVDGLIETMLAATSHEDFVTAVRAYDRVLRSGAYVVPLFHAAHEWVAYRKGLAHPSAMPQYDQPAGVTLDSWWWKSGL